METKRTETTVTTVTTTVTTGTTGTPTIDRSNEKLISNETTFNQLLRILASNPDVVANAQAEAKAKSDEEKETNLREAFGEDYALVFDKKGEQKKSRRPGPVQLRSNVPRVASIEIGDNALLEVFENGYAVYDNGNRKVVLWVPDCGTATYYFTGLRENEKQYLSQSEEIGLDVLGECAWYHALMIAGENRIEYNMEHPRSKGNTSDFDMEDVDIKPAAHWVGGSHFDDPETAYLKKEAAEERRKALTEKQREVYVMRYEMGMSQPEIADVLGSTQQNISKIENTALEKIKNNLEKYISMVVK